MEKKTTDAKAKINKTREKLSALMAPVLDKEFKGEL